MRLRYYILIIFPILSLLIGCSPSRSLQKNEYLLYSQSIKGNKKLPTEPITPLYRQETNRKFLGTLPYVGIYNFGRKFYDSSKVQDDIAETTNKYERRIEAETDSVRIEKLKSKLESKLARLTTKLEEGNWIMRAPGEPPAVYDSSLMHETVRQMGFYLHSKGFFQGNASAKIDTSGKKIRVVYRLKEGPAYTIDKVAYETEDPNVQRIVDSTISESYLKTNERYDEEKLTAERDRLNKLMKNNGYYDFTRQFIFFEIDTTEAPQKMAIYALIKNPADKQPHKQFRVDKIIFNTDITNIPGEQRDTVEYRGIYYAFYKKNFSKKILGYKVNMTPGELYNQSKVQESQIQLASLDMYKFINVNFEKANSDSSSNSLTAHIRTSPFKKYQISDEWGVNVGQGFIPGPFASLSFKDRNVFGGFEIAEASLRYSLEAVLAQKADPGEESEPLIMKEYGGTLSLTFPQIFFPVFGKKARHYSPKTRISSSYTFVDRPEYVRGTLRVAQNYSWQRTENKQYIITPIDINFVRTYEMDSLFRVRLKQLELLGNNLNTSFNTSIVTSFNASYTFNNQQFGTVKKSTYWKPFFEIGGNVVNAASRYLTQEKDNQFLGLQYFEFVKVSSDLRYYFPIKQKNTFAMRFNVGYARPYGSSDKTGLFVLPYEKYFFTGGSSSNRAWKPRRLGPGGFKDTLRGYLYEQPGEILLETNFEYRSNLFSFIDWAFFIDAGNVWNIKYDPNRPDSQFKFDSFLSQIAIGTGLGLRLDFTFLILRFDVGIKAWDPGERGEDRFVLKEIYKKPPFGKKEQTVFNIGIGYPF